LFLEQDEGQQGRKEKFTEFSYQQPAGGGPTASAARKSPHAKQVPPTSKIVYTTKSPASSKAKVKNAKEPVDDLNYFDKLTFQESYATFSASECGKPREVVLESREPFHQLTDLEELDRQYLLGGQEPQAGVYMLFTTLTLVSPSRSNSYRFLRTHTEYADI
jgi:hypothetical protein